MTKSQNWLPCSCLGETKRKSKKMLSGTKIKTFAKSVLKIVWFVNQLLHKNVCPTDKWKDFLNSVEMLRSDAIKFESSGSKMAWELCWESKLLNFFSQLWFCKLLLFKCFLCFALFCFNLIINWLNIHEFNLLLVPHTFA